MIEADPFAKGLEALATAAALYGAPRIIWGNPKRQGKRTDQTSRCGCYQLIEDMGPRGLLFTAIYTPENGDKFTQRIWVERTREQALGKLQSFHEGRYRIGEAA